MRVIAGDFKGRKLKAVPGTLTRPTSDKVKEAFFHRIGPFFSGGSCLDLFAGSGSLAIEAISRGMDYAILVDKNKQAIHTILNNIRLLQIEQKTKLLRMDAFKALQRVANESLSFDLILIDPPYHLNKYVTLIEKIDELNLLNEDGIIYCEHEGAEVLPETINQFQVIKTTNYGKTTAITIYQKSNT